MKEVPVQALRDFAWDVSQSFPPKITDAHVAVFPVAPRLALIEWAVAETENQKVIARGVPLGARLVLRVYEPHKNSVFDIGIGSLQGTYYLHYHDLEQTIRVEIGYVSHSGFASIAKSNDFFFDRDRPSSRFSFEGMWVMGDKRAHVDNIFGTQVFARLGSIKDLRADCVFALLPVFGPLPAWTTAVAEATPKWAKVFDGTSVIVSALPSELDDIFARADAMAAAANKAFRPPAGAVVHCFEWFGGAFGVLAKKKSKTPFVLSMTSIESERSAGMMNTPVSREIVKREAHALSAAARVIVPTENLRDRIVKEYGVPHDGIEISALPNEQEHQAPSIGDVKRELGLGPGPMVLYAGEIGWNDGADLFVDAAITVAGKRHDTQFVLAGAGPMRGGLEQRARGAGLGSRIHFWGDVGGDTFEKLLLSSDFVVIPARTSRPAGLADNAIAHGRAVLTTHGARLSSVRHGQNGLITYDNPGSIVWGISELLANPLSSNMMRGLAKQHAIVGNTLDSQCIQYWIAACLARTDHV